MKAFLEEQDNEEMSKKINVYILKIFLKSHIIMKIFTRNLKRMQKMQQIF